ncbi:FecR family protein [Sphingomonas sp. Leaf21]|uniref:FecR family protein n=1 Tax=Sphingomonas sp. Leaf21 TaxID=2876550 RepID=UPI001E5EB6F0|nr:FecR domain-containing protein [Sphingomonas sp. Leaf21]
MNERVAVDDPVVDEAVAWMVLVQDGQADEEASAGLQRWLDADLRHRTAWDSLQKSLTPFKVVDRVPGLGGSLVEVIDRKRSRRELLSAAAVIGSSATALAITERVYPLDGLIADASTRTGERKRVELPDGSLLLLNARSRCNFDFDGDRRGIDMLEGTAMVTIEAGASPFLVRSGILDVKVDHGESIVTRRSTIASVINVRGDAAMGIRGGFAFALKAGEGYAVRGVTLSRMTREETQGASAWSEGRLILQNRTLADMIDAYRPYCSGLIFLAEAVAQQRLSGVFDLGQMEEALDLVRKLLPIRIMTLGNLVTRIGFDPGGLAR